MKSVSHSRSFELQHPVEKLFPLFSPEGEKSWVPGWDYENIMGSTELSEDYVFLTRDHDHGMAEAIWLVKRYEPESHLVAFYKVEPGHKVGVVTVKCSEAGEAATRVTVTYKYIALSAEGEAFVAAFDESAYESFIGEWRDLLSSYLAS